MKLFFTFILILIGYSSLTAQVSFEVTYLPADCSGNENVYDFVLQTTEFDGLPSNVSCTGIGVGNCFSLQTPDLLIINGSVTSSPGLSTVVVEFTDNLGVHSTVLNLNLPSPPSIISEIFTTASCEANDGGAQLIVSPNNPDDYVINWSGGLNTSGLLNSGLSPGSHTYYFYESVCNTTQTISFTITQDPPVEVTIQENNGGCLTPEDMEYEAIATGGSGTFTYSWEAAGATNTYAAATAVADGFVQADIYTVTVTDENNPSCTDTEDVIVIAGDNDCIGDLDCNGIINAGDLLDFLSYNFLSPTLFDMNYDGVSDSADLLAFLGIFNTTCP